MGSHHTVFPRQPQSRRIHAVQLLLEVDGLRLRPVQRVAHAGGILLRGVPGRHEQAALAPHRELGRARRQPVQRHVEIQHPRLQVLRVQPRADGQPHLPRAGALRRLPGRPRPQVLRPRRRVPVARRADIPPHRRRQDSLHHTGDRPGRFRLARGQELLRRRREGAAQDRPGAALQIPQDSRKLGSRRRLQHTRRNAGNLPSLLPHRARPPLAHPRPCRSPHPRVAPSRPRIHKSVRAGHGPPLHGSARKMVRRGRESPSPEP